MTDRNLKALYIVVNMGFAEKIVEYIRSQGSCGATIINARRYSFQHKEIMGISTDKEKEIVLTVIDSDAADRIMDSIKHYSGFKTEAHGICFTLPVSNAVGLSL
ncbi:MAG: Transcriptional regulator [Lachnoclostridium sp.]|jgi:nitrogen regulatory protein PII